MQHDFTRRPLAIAVFLTCLAAPLAAQTIGTFSWQQQPYCNVITVTITQVGAVYRLEGTDDQCGTPRRASASGMAFPNPNGTVGLGIAVVTNDGGAGGTPLHIDAAISLATLSGTWRDSAGNTGGWVFTSGAGSPGSPRPLPRLSFPGGVSVGGGTVTNVGAPAAATDATNRGYVDATTKSARSIPVTLLAHSGLITGNATSGFFGCVTFDTAATSSIRLDLQLPDGARLSEVRVKYFHPSGSTGNIALELHSVDFDNTGGSDVNLQPSLNSSSSVSGARIVTFTPGQPPAAVSATRSYYFEARAPAHTGSLWFCGATAIYTLP